MKRHGILARIAAALIAVLVLLPEPVLACATCFGKSDSALTRGMNMGIFTLLGTIAFVLMGVASFFVFLARRSLRADAAFGNEAGETSTRSGT